MIKNIDTNVEMKKIVIVLNTEYSKKQEDYFCIVDLLGSFDIEYWDCSDIVQYGQHVTSRLERPFVYKIQSIDDFKKRLMKLPYDTLIILDVFYSPGNYRFHKILSSFFKHIIFVGFYTNSQIKCNENNRYIGIDSNPNSINSLKQILYKSDLCRLLIKVLFHPKRIKEHIWSFFDKKGREMYIEHEITASPQGVMKINHPDVNKIFFQRDHMNNTLGRYIVYIDQNFPYYKELVKQHPDFKAERVASSHFYALNKFFRCVEEKYKCPVIIAAHPSSDYSNNPFDGRKVIYQQTENLVANSIAACLHSSNALSYVMLYNKPVLVLIDNAIRQVPNPKLATENTIALCGNLYVDMDTEEYEVKFTLIPDDKRRAYLEKYFGAADLKPQVSNTELFKMHFEHIYNEIYRSNY